MITMMPKKKSRNPDGRSLRYDPVAIDKLLEWSTRLGNYAAELKGVHEMATQHGVETFEVDGGYGFDKHIERVREVTSEASGDIRGKCLDRK
jgi:hypothetical protein